MTQCVCKAAAVAGTALLLGSSVLVARQDPATATAPRAIEVVARRFAFEPARIEVRKRERERTSVAALNTAGTDTRR
jgi:hypothetical protein